MTIHHRPHPGTTIRVLIGVCLALALTLLLLPLSASAHAIYQSSLLTIPAAGPTMQAQAGFSSRYRDGNWIPVQVTLSNNGPDFNGKVSVNTSTPFGAGNSGSTYIYQQAVSLPNGSQKQVTLYVPFTSGTPGTTLNISVDLLDSNNQPVTTQSAALRALGSSDIFVGFLFDQTPGQTPGLGTLTNITLPTQGQGGSIQVEPLSAATMPKIAAALKNFDVIIIDNFTTSSLSQDQLAALQNWVQQGGKLIVVGGPEWQHTLAPLTSLLPVTLAGTATLPAGTHLFPLGGPTKSGPNQGNVADSVSSPITISTATVNPQSTVVLASGKTPLIVQGAQGQGQVSYLAFDPSLDPLASWSGTTTIWQGLLTRMLGNQLLTSNTAINPTPFVQNFGGMETLLQSLFPSAIPSTWVILALLLGYVLILGPVRLFIVKRFKNRSWSWRIVLSTIVVFSLLSYGLALQQKGSSILSSSISVIQLSRPGATGSLAHTATYVGVFVPNNGDFQVHIPGDNLVQSTENQQFGPQGPLSPQRTTITSTPDGTDVDLQGVDIWTLRSVVSRRDHQVSGGIVSHLAIQNNTLVGTVTNTLAYGLSDVYLLTGNQFVSIGHLGAGESRTINLTITNNPPATGTTSPSLADQIASSRGLNPPYGPYSFYNNSSPSELQRRMAMLATVGGEFGGYAYCGNGAPCFQKSVVIRGTTGGILPSQAITYTSSSAIFFSGGGPRLATDDPLLLPGAPATLIGWADRLPDGESNATVNGSYTTTSQEVLVQAPLDVNFSGNVNVPSSLITSRVVDIQSQGSTLQMPIPGVYQMTTGSPNTGSITFEYALANGSGLRANTISLVDPLNGGFNPVGPAPAGQQLTIDHVQASLYNWQSGKWDSFTFNQSALSVNNAQPYVGPDGRIFLQLADQNDTQGTIFFSKPQIQLQGTAP
ncbi:MAG TPA: hypothetical protein VKY19_12055 [Ktedonosporobacter sp.]|jgi:uncharacterized membrane protein YhaH (DUF805 family)|nr:hypothetical protein [Ktedonosporobacter sp.]